MEEFEKEEIMEGVKKHLEYVEQKFPQLKVLGIFVIGSQNYGLSLQIDEYRSNLDTMVIVQTEEGFDGFNTIKYGDNDRISICDYNWFYHLLYVSSNDMVEALFTDFREIEDDRLYILIENADQIAAIDKYRILYGIVGHVIYQCQTIAINMPHIDKPVYNLFRLYVFARDLYYGVPYRDALLPDSIDAKILIDIKTGKFSEVNDISLQKFAEAIKASAINLLKQIEEHVDDFTIDKSAYDILDEFKKQFN